MNVQEAIKSRKSVRKFKKKKVSMKTVKEIIKLASYSPSGSNTQPWNIHVLTGKSLSDFTKKIKKEFLLNGNNLKLERLNYMEKYREPYLSRRRKVGWDLYQILNIKKGDYNKTKEFHSQNYEFFGAPVGIIFSIEKDLGWMSWLDYGMFLQNMCLAARSFGLHTCSQAAWGLVYKKANKILKIKKNLTIHCGMALGYVDQNAEVNSLNTEREEINSFCKFFN